MLYLSHTQLWSDNTRDNMADQDTPQYQYRKIMKPLLERKRRARINGCLDELKELMEYLGADSGQRMQRLEKADVLEVTVNHLRNLKANGQLNANESLSGSSTFRSGYSACAGEVASFICSPYSGVQQPQAARIAMVVADGLSKLHSSSRNSEICPSKTSSVAQHIKDEFKIEVREETNVEKNNLDDSAPLDLSVK